MISGAARWVAVLCLINLTMSKPTDDGAFHLRIIHTNDMHSRFEQVSQSAGRCSEADANAGRCYGGFARVRTAANDQKKKAKDENVPLLFLNAGDNYQGTIWYTIYKWKVVARFLEFLGIDAMSLGNHEFDDGVDGLVPFLNNISIPVVTCNLGLDGEPDLAETPLLPSIVFERGGQKIGVVGYLTPETTTLSNPENVVIYDEVPSLTKEVQKLKDQGVDIIICVGHSGYDADLKIAKEVPEIDVVVGGHTNTFLYTGSPPDIETPAGLYPVIVTQASNRKVAVVQAYAYTKYLGVLDLDFDARGELINATGNPVLLDKTVQEDPEVIAEINVWKPGVENATKQPIGKTKVLLYGTCYFEECNLGNLMNDAFVDYAVLNFASNWTIAPIAFVQAGGIRSSINLTDEGGIITREDVMIVAPFYNALNIIKLKGKYLLEALEWSVTRYDPSHVIGRGEFLQTSGLQVLYDISKPVGSRVISAKARCGNCSIPDFFEIDNDTDYNIILPSFLARGGDHYSMFSEHGEKIVELDDLDTDVIMQFIERRTIIYQGNEGRIEFVFQHSKSSSSKLFEPNFKTYQIFVLPFLLFFKNFNFRLS